jgi:hypothetical protein
MDEELIGGDPLHRLRWGDAAGWVIGREDETGRWVQVAVYGEKPPLVARHFAKWLSSNTGLTFDQAEDAVRFLREQSPSRFIDPFDEPMEAVPERLSPGDQEQRRRFAKPCVGFPKSGLPLLLRPEQR